MKLPALLIAAVAGALPTLTAPDDWVALHFTGHHGLSIRAHDSGTGLLVSVSRRNGTRWFSDGDDARVLQRGGVAALGLGAEFIELSDPGADGKRLLKDIGQSPMPGSVTDGLISAHRPTESCTSRFSYRLWPHEEEPATFVEATVCSAEQRRALEHFVAGRLWERLPPVVEASGGDRINRVTEAELRRVDRGTPLVSVLRLLGDPSGVWPSYPTGLTLVYEPPLAVHRYSFVVTLTQTRVVSDVRVLTPDRWVE